MSALQTTTLCIVILIIKYGAITSSMQSKGMHTLHTHNRRADIKESLSFGKNNYDYQNETFNRILYVWGRIVEDDNVWTLK